MDLIHEMGCYAHSILMMRWPGGMARERKRWKD